MTAIVEWTNDASSEAEWGPIATPPQWDADHLHGILFQTDKEYDFFAAIAGARNRFGVEPLIPRRGRPRRLSLPAVAYFGRTEGACAGWLLLSEIDAAIAHISRGDEFFMGFELQVGLDVMRRLVDRLGDAHVRLVFEIESA